MDENFPFTIEPDERLNVFAPNFFRKRQAVNAFEIGSSSFTPVECE